jgi:hypothetical protein
VLEREFLENVKRGREEDGKKEKTDDGRRKTVDSRQ